MIERKYEFFEHTADIGLKAYGNTKEELFENSALGMFSLLADLKNVKMKIEKKILLKNSTIEELLIDWLRELLYIFATERIIFAKFSAKFISNSELIGYAIGDKYENLDKRLKKEIKAVTYHELKVRKNDNWTCEVIFDV